MAPAVLQRKSGAYVSSIEREQIARDLHDGVLQSLIATEMQIDLLRRQSGAGPTLDPAETLADVQEFIRIEVRRLRGQIEELRSNPSSCRLLPGLTELVEEFQRETGIVTTLTCDVREDLVAQHLAHEILHIVEEALANIRKHSGARKSEVRLSFRGGTLQVVIQDDGRGFGFIGRLYLAQLEAAQMGPRVIRERVHSMNGELVLESDPDRGSRLEVRFAIHCGKTVGSCDRYGNGHEGFPYISVGT